MRVVRKFLRRLIGALTLGYSATTPAALSLPLEPVAFTAAIMQAVRERAQPSLQISASEPLVLRLELSGFIMDARLDALHRHCVAQHGICRDAIKQYVNSCLEMVAGAPAMPQPSHLRVLVRGTPYVKQVKATHTARGSAAPVVKEYLPNVWMVLAVAGESVQWIATRTLLERLELDEAAAFELGLKNTRATMLRISHVARPFGQSQFSFSLGNYDSSRLLMHADWAPLAQSGGGDLLVGIPASDMVVFGTVQSSADLKRLKDLVTSISREAVAPLGRDLYRWRPHGWEIVSGDDVRASPGAARSAASP